MGNTSAMTDEFDHAFADADCRGWLCAEPLDGGDAVTVDADEPVVAASVIKVAIALDAECRFAEGAVDPGERVLLDPASRTAGPTGFSLFDDPVEVSLRDLVVAMLTISDNAATDALLDRVGIADVNARMRGLGLPGTYLTGNMAATIDSIGDEAGFDGWAGLSAWLSTGPGPEGVAAVNARVRASTALAAATATRTTAREATTLLRLIWSDAAGPPQACLRVRQSMGCQLTKHRLAAGFPAPARVSAKSGGLAGVVRNEIGVVEYPDGTGYAVAVFTRPRGSAATEVGASAVIGATAARAVGTLRGTGAR